MKKLHHTSVHRALCLLTGLLLLASCSTKQAELPALFSRVPADVETVYYGHPVTIIESMGGRLDGSGVTLPNYMDSSQDFFNSLHETIARYEGSGALTDQVVGFRYADDPVVTIMYAVADRDRLCQTITASGFKPYQTLDSVELYRSVDAEQWYGTVYSYIALCGGYAYWLDHVSDHKTFDIATHMRRIFDAAARGTLADQPVAAQLVGGNAGAVLYHARNLVEVDPNALPGDLSQLMRGNICSTFDLSANDFTMQTRCFDDEGKPLEFTQLRQFGDLTSTINTTALSYLAPHESLVYAVSLKDMDWDATIEALGDVLGSTQQKAALNVAKTYLKYIDGTVALGVGPANGVASLMHLGRTNQVMDDWEFTLVCEVQPQAAATILGDLRTVLSTFNITCDDQADGLTFSPLGAKNGTFYVRVKDNLLVISDRAIASTRDNAAVTDFPYAQYLGALVLCLNRDTQLMRDLGVDRDFLCSLGYDGKSQTTIIRLSLSGDAQTGVLEKLLRGGHDLIERADDLRDKFAH